MHNLIKRLANYSLEKNVIAADQVEWFIYGLEKRISTIIVGIPFLILAFFLSSIPCAVSFFASYFFVRKYIGGFHCETVWGCLIVSLLCEVVALSFFYTVLNKITILVILLFCVLLVYILAPYNHPNMHLTDDEKHACRKKGIVRLWIIVAGIVTSVVAGLSEIAKGFTIGIALASALLCLGYIITGGYKNE